jgi:RND family efflux transporter MFP subunit
MKRLGALLLAGVLVTACAPEAQPEVEAETSPAGTWLAVHEVMRAGTFEAIGVAEPYQEATLSTKLMGTVIAVPVREGDVVRAGAVLAEIDARELSAKAAQVAASVAEAEAMHREALTNAQRMRTLFAEDAAPRAQLDAAETGLARTEAAVRAARAGATELAAMTTYARVTAPFAGTIVRRSVDPGAFAAPGAPLLTIQDAGRLRVSVTVPPAVARGLKRGTEVAARIEDVPASAVVEGVVPAGGSLYTVNAIVDNAAGEFLAGSAAALLLPQGARPGIVLPRSAVRREGDLTGVLVRHESGSELRWVRLGRALADSVEVLAGLRPGEQVLVPAGEGALPADGQVAIPVASRVR